MEQQTQNSRLYYTGVAGCGIDVGELTGEKNENVALDYFNHICFCRSYFFVFLTSGSVITPYAG